MKLSEIEKAFEILYTLSSEDKVGYDLHLFHKESDNG